MNHYEIFFNLLKGILSVIHEKEIQASVRGENYNVFEIIGISTSEVGLHSSILCDLLNPNGLHGLGIKPLKAFCNIINVQIPDEELPGANVVKEYHIGSISNDYCQGGNIDILIELKSHTIVIENKIYAGDQKKQLLRYKNHIKHKPHTLLYLTLDGKEPSDESTGGGIKNNKDFFCISYAADIDKWLQEVLSMSISRPLLRETIQQYIRVIHKLTNKEMEQTDNTELFEAMDKYPEVVQELVSKQWYYRLHLVDKYIITPIKQHFESMGFLWYEDSNTRTQSKYAGFCIYRPDWVKMIAIEFDKYDFRDGYYGVWDPKGRGSNVAPLFGTEKTQAWPYGWKYMEYRNWDISTAKDIISGKVAEYVIEVFDELHKRIIENPAEYPMS